MDGLNKSIDERNVMRWTINLSDDDMKKVGYVQSSYTVMAQDVAKVLQHYAKVCTRKHTNNENLYRIFCGKEFIYTSFRVKLLEILY
ncbi:MAG: hypothetical protein LBD75_06820 [Candidatus Peribacteria bacterium]|nr:hypothetical protein [Candidatus Peribacteria bacterium]